MAGGSTAGTIQLGTGLLRLISSKATLGGGNVVLASTENAAAIIGSILSFLFPIFICLLVIILVVWILSRIISRKSSVRSNDV